MFFIWTMKRCNDAISFAVATGQVSVRSNLYDVVAFYMESGAHYLVFALLLTVAGILLWRRQTTADEYIYIDGSEVAEFAPDEAELVQDETSYVIEFDEDGDAGDIDYADDADDTDGYGDVDDIEEIDDINDLYDIDGTDADGVEIDDNTDAEDAAAEATGTIDSM